MSIRQEHERFYDPTDGPGSRMQIVLHHVDDMAKENWKLDRRIAYHDRHFEQPIVVPRDPGTFTTDLTSVPQLFTWLVPRTGTHLGAAIIHDGLTPPFSVSGLPDWEGPEHITQMQADRVFRDAMADLGTPTVRRWLVWAAVSVPTAMAVSLLRKITVITTLVAIAVLGWLSTMDLFDQGSWLPWMGRHSWVRELVGGGLAALAIPLLLAASWPKGTRPAGAMVGVAMAALLHVTVAVGAVTVGYQLVEYRWKVWASPRRALKVAGTIGALAAVMFTWWWCRHY